MSKIKSSFKVLAFGIILSLSSCSTQICIFEIGSTSVKEEGTEAYQYEDEYLVIEYDLWDEGGAMAFSLYNKTNKPIYIDWNNSNFIRKGYSQDYWQDVVSSGSVGKVVKGNNALYTENITIRSKEKPSIQLPPKSYISIKRFGVNHHVQPNKKLKGNNIETTTYKKENAKMFFRNYIAYSFDKDYSELNFIDNEFWVYKASLMKRKTYENSFKSLMGSKKNKYYDVIKTGFFYVQ